MTANSQAITKLFIANRGEIARRIASSAKRMGIQVAVIREQGQPRPQFLWGLVDHYVEVPRETTALYLDGPLMVRLAKDSGCDALHPGFGFLSENQAFAQAVIDSGLIWVGPSPKAIDAMASKARAREWAQKAKVPCLPGLGGIRMEEGLHTREQLKNFANEHGFPLLIKAALGGGGKGMRIVRSHDDLISQAEAAGREALSSFGDSSLIIEKYLASPRHIEVQVFGDSFGNVLSFGDRDCSLQRRHQKILEEAPAPQLSAETREAIHSQALNLAKAVAYQSAGTVEFLLEELPNNGGQRCYFLEMNTRLQVEHPVTEEVFGLDLVAMQLEVAQGKALSRELWDLKPKGHSVELRIYAEDVERDFFPAPGIVSAFLPYHAPGIRWEYGLDSIDEITPHFDPMVAKLIATGQNREDAMARLVEALERSVFSGPANNMGYLATLLKDKDFVARPVSTHYVLDTKVQVLEAMAAQRHKETEAVAQIKRGLSSLGIFESALDEALSPSPLQKLTRGIFQTKAQIGQECDIILCHQQQSSGIVANMPLTSKSGVAYYRGAHSTMEPFAYSFASGPGFHESFIFKGGHSFHQRSQRSQRAASSKAMNHSEAILAPVPGKVVKVLKAEGAAVKLHETVMILESMKMEFEVKAAKEGIIQSIQVKVGEQVESDHLLMKWKE